MKTFIKVLIVLGILAIVLILSANYFISRIIDRDSVVRVVEENLNTRLDLKDINVNIFSTTPSLKLNDVKFAPRDEYADEGVHIDERSELESATVTLTSVKFNVDVVHLFRSGDEIISEISIGESSSISEAGALDKFKSSLSTLSDIGVDLKFLSEKIELQNEITLKTLFVDGKISFIDDINLETANYRLSLTKNSWFDLGSNDHKFQGYFLLSADESEKILNKVDKYIDEKTSDATDNGYSVDKKKIKEKLLKGLIRDNRILIDFISQGNINDPEVNFSSVPESLEKIVEEAVRDLQ